MRTLIIQLPPGLASPATSYPHTWVQAGQGLKPAPVQWSVGSLLPAADRQTETVAVLPAAVVSWHRVDLPPGLHKQPARLQAALQGLLEDRLLDDASLLHLALEPGARAGQTLWVAACDAAWLRATLASLQAAGRPVSRIAPALWPQATVAQQAFECAGQTWLAASGPHGRYAMPCAAQ